MPLLDTQVQVRDLLMGPGTNYGILDDFNPFALASRADQTGKRAWNHGGWSGVEWRDEVVVPLRLRVKDPSEATLGRWLELHQQLVAAFRPVGEATADTELRFSLGGREYVMFGRPRMVEPEVTTIRSGWSVTQAAFVALDPFIYAGTETSIVNIGLPTFTGGLTVPFTVPFTIDAVAADGFASLTNEGTADTGLAIRLDGPVESPTVTLIRDDGTFQALSIDVTLSAGQWLDIDTKARTVLLNGTISRRGQASGQWPILPPGTHELRWRSPNYNATAQMSVTFRSAWW